VRYLEAGKPITQTFRETGIFNPIVLDMTHTGEMTGSLDQMLLKVSEFYEGEAAIQARRNALIFGVVVFIAVAIYVLIVLINFYVGYGQNLFKTAESYS
jgi:type II secretory pathway component PulF